MPETHKLSVAEKIGYAFGDGASNLFWMTFIYFQLNFYTDTFGLTATALATMLLVTRVWDTGFDLLIGMLADRTRTRWGKFRPYLLWMALPFGIISVLTFTTPSFSPSGKLVYAYVTLSLMMMVYSAINVPYSALMGVISPDSQERTSLSSYRFTFAFLAGLAVQWATLYLVGYFGKGNSARGYQVTMGVYAALAVALFLLTFALTRERVQPVKDQRTSLGRDLRDLLANTPWLILCALGILTLCYVSIRNGSIIYYFKYYVGSEKLAATYMVVGALMSMLGTFLVQFVTPKTGRKNAYIGLMLLTTVLTALSYWVAPQQFVLMFVYQVLVNLLMGPTSALVWAMYADTADYSEWRTGRRATGLVFSASGMSNKFGWAIGGSIAAWLLGYYGFHANVQQTAQAQHGIRLLMSVIPAIGSALAGLGMFLYRLDERTTRRIQTELAEIRAKAARA
ncbi:MAG: MFS transporter [Bryobacteraceae bacterium]